MRAVVHAGHQWHHIRPSTRSLVRFREVRSLPRVTTSWQIISETTH
jgi:hypothetical protein